MSTGRLFQALVVFGAALTGAGCAGAAQGTAGQSTDGGGVDAQAAQDASAEDAPYGRIQAICANGGAPPCFDLDATAGDATASDATLDVEVRCGTEGGVCRGGQACLDRRFINGLPTADAAEGSFDSYSCQPNPCGGSPAMSCLCDLCAGESCTSTGVDGLVVTCTTQSVCASGETPIATADGDRPIASLRPGDLVYSADGPAIRLVPLLRVGRVAVFHHHVVELTLANGATLKISPGHPTADGRRLGDLRPGDAIDGVTVVARVELPYDEPYTYDILPASDSRTYFAAGVRVGTTLSAPSP